jgi:hypothetical protein
LYLLLMSEDAFDVRGRILNVSYEDVPEAQANSEQSMRVIIVSRCRNIFVARDWFKL